MSNPLTMTDDDPLCECANCGAQYRESELNTIRDYHQRVAPGEEAPAGECINPACRALCHVIDAENTLDLEPRPASKIKPRFVAAWRNDNDDPEEHVYGTFDIAKERILHELSKIIIGYDGSDTQRLVEYVVDEVHDAETDFETVKVAGFVYSVTQQMEG